VIYIKDFVWIFGVKIAFGCVNNQNGFSFLQHPATTKKLQQHNKACRHREGFVKFEKVCERKC